MSRDRAASTLLVIYEGFSEVDFVIKTREQYSPQSLSDDVFLAVRRAGRLASNSKDASSESRSVSMFI